MASFAPRAAAGRRAVQYEAQAEPSADSLVFAAAADFRIEGMWKDGGHCYTSSRLPPGIVPDRFELWEDDRQLGPSGAAYEAIRTSGNGRFLIEGRNIHLAASDNSDPRRNSRSYVLRRKPSIAASNPGSARVKFFRGPGRAA